MTPEEWLSLPAGTLIRGCESILDEATGYYFLTPSLKKWSAPKNKHPKLYYSEGIYFLSEEFEIEFSLLDSAEAVKTFTNSHFSTRMTDGCFPANMSPIIWDEVFHIKDVDRTKILGMLLGKHCIGLGPQDSPVICSSILMPSGKTWALMLTTKPNTGKDIVLYY